MKMTTIKDIAEATGVSMKTVSRVLNNEPNVREAVRDMVKDKARELRYHPNPSARSLKTRRSYVLAHFYDNPNSDYLNKVYKGMHDVCRKAAYFAVMEPLEAPYADNLRDYLTDYRIDGAVLTPPLSDNAALLDALDENNVPYVRISPGIRLESSSYVYVDNKAATERLTCYLIDKGHRHIAFIYGPETHTGAHDRLVGFRNAVRDAGLSDTDCPVHMGDFTTQSGAKLAETILTSHKNVTAIMAANDDMAVGVIMMAAKMGLSIPEDLVVTGFDGAYIGQIIWPALTTLNQPVEDMAARVTDMLLSRLKDPDGDIEACEHPVDLIERQSTKSEG